MENFNEVRKLLDEEKKKGAFIFSPSDILPASKTYFMPVIEKVFLNDTDVYKAQSKFRIHYSGLLKLSIGAAMKWSVTDTRRTDNRSDKKYCSFMAVGGVMDATGQVQWTKAEKDVDLEIVEMELEDQYEKTWNTVKKSTGNQEWKKQGHTTQEGFVKAMVRRDLIQHSKNKLTKAESGAKARVIRSVLGLQGTYANQNQLIGMPFIMVHFVQNTNHPEVKSFLLQQVSQTQNMIYGGTASPKAIGYFDTDADSTIIEADVTELEDEGDEVEPETQSFKPADTSFTFEDFQALAIDEQVPVLKEMCKDKGEEWEVYVQRSQESGGIEGAPQEWRDDFFNYLKG